MSEEEIKELEEEWRKDYARVYKEREFKATTPSGIPLKTVYTPSDIANIDYKGIGMPGLYPYTRGTHPLQYQFRPWTNEVIMGYGLPENTRERYEHMWKEGMSSYLETPVFFPAFDLPSQHGYDPDHPAARGRIGQSGVSVSTMKDYEILFDGLPLHRMITFLGTNSTAMPALAMYIVYAERRGFTQEKLNGNVWNYPWAQWHWDSATYRPRDAFKLIVELIKYVSNNMPRWRPMSLQAYNMEEAGANAIQEVAFILATSIAVTEECIKAGIDPDSFLPRFGFVVSTTIDFFETVAKVRALRKMWAKINKERFGCKDQHSLRASIYLQAAGSSLTAQQPLNNIARLAIEALAGAAAGVDGISTISYDEALSLPSEEAMTTSLRIQQVLFHESGIRNVTDPLAGSYYVEWLTNKMEEEATKLIEKLDQIGYIKAWETGWLKSEVMKSALEWRQAVDNGEKVIVGVNKYVLEEEPKIPVFKVDPKVEEIAVERVKKFKAERDNAKTETALANMEQKAKKVQAEWPEASGELMPAVIDAAKADATLGEMTGVLKKVFGWGYV
jgi:methylmalonyl-CoA mutase N-terminal domain/subunit